MAETLDLPPGNNGVAPMAWLKQHRPDLVGRALVAQFDGTVWDLSRPLPAEAPARIRVLTFEDEHGREVYWHSTAHLLAQAVQALFPEVKLTIGPPIAEGFYYDFDAGGHTFTPDDLTRIEAKMREFAKADFPIAREDLPKPAAREMLGKRGEPYKIEMLDETIVGDQVSIYKQGDWLDLCRGPHVPSTGYLKAFKLLSVAGAYWRGKEGQPQLQRIYGISFPSDEALADFLRRRAEAEARDHRKLGRELDFFSFHEDVGAGFALWHPKGALVRELLEDLWRREHRARGYSLVFTPHLGRRALWETSGHTDYYLDNMYGLEVDEQPYFIKPMNCPFHILIFKSHTRSYRDLPLRLCEFGTVYRNERSGVLHGMLRVRGFTQDDAHIFCTMEQVEQEAGAAVDFGLGLLKACGFDQFELRLATRPEKFAGTVEQWQTAESALARVMESRKLPHTRDEGGAVFYGPKIDLDLIDAIGRRWQATTVQLDFNLPGRFGAVYAGADGQTHTPVLIHRALFGSMERFLGALIEHHAGALPVWLAPVQAMVIPIADRHNEAAERLAQRLREAGLRAEVDERHESTRAKIRDAELQKVPYMLVVGDREIEQDQVALRLHGKGDQGPQPVAGFLEMARAAAAVPALR